MKSYIAEPPVKKYEKHVAVTDDKRIGKREAIVRSTIRISRVKTRPAIGALKIPDTAAVAPHPTSNISVRLSKWNILPKLLPIAEPVKTIGASAPTDPPKPIVMAEATIEDQVLCPFNRDCFVDIA